MTVPYGKIAGDVKWILIIVIAIVVLGFILWGGFHIINRIVKAVKGESV